MMAHGTSALIASAAGTRIALFMAEPLATAHTTGSSRSAITPATCCEFSARSSPSTPAVFLAATLVRIETSSSSVAMSSISVSRLLAIVGIPSGRHDRERARRLLEQAEEADEVERAAGDLVVVAEQHVLGLGGAGDEAHVSGLGHRQRRVGLGGRGGAVVVQHGILDPQHVRFLGVREHQVDPEVHALGGRAVERAG